MRNANPTPHKATAIAALVVQLATDAPGLPEGCNVQLFPDGEFAARDGRPASVKNCEAAAWRMDGDIAAALIAQVESRETPLFIDYEHHTLTAKEGGHKAVAAGWVESLAYVPTQGLFAKVAWTDTARQHIQADEYRFISPLFGFDLKTGAIRTLINAALTNNPALDGMAAVAAALKTNLTEEDMNPKDSKGQEALSEDLAERLRWMLNLPVTATAQEIIAELDKVKTQLGGEAAASTGVDLVAILQTKDSQITALTAQASQPDPIKFAPVSALEALTQDNATLKARVAELEQQNGTAALSAQIEAALADGRLNKGLEGWIKDLAKANPEQAQAYLEKAAPIAALSSMQTNNQGTPPTPSAPGSGVAALSAEEKEAARLQGKTDEEYLACKEGK
ncbi:MAG: phage protease [Desulfovibrio sp.]|nr:phage protease [Desulfovibrio sp.]MBI4960412.1 phage protease [Desulfovibrio sp.]